MKAIRGATTLKCDTPEEIRDSVSCLLNEIKVRNRLNEGDIICILFSSTADIRSFYPAKAARESGFFNVPLFSSLEPEISGSLKRCIRVMFLAENVDNPEHVYLKDAVKLRKDLTQVINIALDGPAGSGKSTVSKLIAKKFDILCLDTGAMYRACALKCLKEKADIYNGKAVERIISEIDLTVKYENGEQITLLDGVNVSEEIRKPEVSMAASTVSAIACVREKMVELQRGIAEKTSCILDGRDIGTNVLPNAKFKFYLTAAPEVRAQRRAAENAVKGYNSDFKEVLADVILRDKQDATRKIAPLKQATDAVLVDSTNMNIAEVVSYISKKIQEKI